MEKLAAEFRGRAVFVLVYCREAHPSLPVVVGGSPSEPTMTSGFCLTDPALLDQAGPLRPRARALAQAWRMEGGTRRVLVDDGSRSVELLFGQHCTDHVVIVGRDGKIAWNAGYLSGDGLRAAVASAVGSE
jgi:hypothetical protein